MCKPACGPGGCGARARGPPAPGRRLLALSFPDAQERPPCPGGEPQPAAPNPPGRCRLVKCSHVPRRQQGVKSAEAHGCAAWVPPLTSAVPLPASVSPSVTRGELSRFGEQVDVRVLQERKAQGGSEEAFASPVTMCGTRGRVPEMLRQRQRSGSRAGHQLGPRGAGPRRPRRQMCQEEELGLEMLEAGLTPGALFLQVGVKGTGRDRISSPLPVSQRSHIRDPKYPAPLRR